MFSMLVSKTPYLLVFRFLLLILTVLTTKYTSTAPLTTINTVRARWVIGLSPGLGLTARLPPTESSSPAFPPESSAESPARGLLPLPLSAPRGPEASAGTPPGEWAAVGPGGRGDRVRGPRSEVPGSGAASAACSSRARGPPKPGSNSSSRRAEAKKWLRQELQCGTFIIPPTALSPRGSRQARRPGSRRNHGGSGKRSSDQILN